MKGVVVDLVISLNGMVARDNGDEDWLPDDGWEEFLKQVNAYRNVIIGRETYDLVKAKYEHDNFDAIDCRLKIIISTQPSYQPPSADYRVAHSPQEALELVREAGLETAYVGGGGKICAAFLNAGLVDTLRLTIMPYIIPSGRSFVADLQQDVSLELTESQQKSGGRLVNNYSVDK